MNIFSSLRGISDGITNQADKIIDRLVDGIVGPLDGIEALFTKDF